MDFYYTYVLKSSELKPVTYVGYTKNLNERIKLHNKGKGAKFTRGKKWKLVYYEKYDSKTVAMKNEYILKKNYKLRKKLVKNK